MKNLIKAVFAKREGEMAPLNALRAIAIWMVLAHHFRGALHQLSPDTPACLSNILENMYSGVDLFFVLSGFLISLGLRKEWERRGNLSFKNFYIKRTLRIFPAYYAFLLISYLVVEMHYRALLQKPLDLQVWQEIHVSLNLIEKAPYYFLYISNYFDRGFVHLWSLSVEEQFYVVFPFLAWLFLFRLKKRDRVFVLVFFCFLAVLFRAMAYFSGMDFEKIYAMTHFRIDSLVAGILLMEFYLVRDRYKALILKYEPWFLAVGILAVLSYVFVERDKTSFYSAVLAYTHVYLSFAVFFVLSFCEESRLARFLSHGFFTPFARLSYTIYLWHINLAALAFSALFGVHYPNNLSLLEILGVFVAISILVTFFSFFLFALIEYPFLRWKDRLAKRARANAAAS